MVGGSKTKWVGFNTGVENQSWFYSASARERERDTHTHTEKEEEAII
jgi:hypothetical protein